MNSSAFCILAFVAFAAILMDSIQIALCDISDTECGVLNEIESNKLLAQNSTDNTPESPNRSQNELFRRPAAKKSLMIIFDGTGSMGDDLVGLGGAANEIVQFLSKKEDQAIENYIFAVFRSGGRIMNQ